jgi:MarR family transcriptional regulator, 2-MHQ and catechol-resistance regulon repressor
MLNQPFRENPIKLFMKIETEIKQEKFINEHQKLYINLIYTTNWLNDHAKHFYDNNGVTMQQYNMLRILRGATEPLSTLEIRERMLDRMSDTSRIVDRLIIKGLVKKTPNKFDKRLVAVSITTKGLALLKKMDTGEMEMIAYLNNLTDTDAKQLNKLLDKIRVK